MAALEAVRFLAEADHKAAHHPISHAEAEQIGSGERVRVRTSSWPGLSRPPIDSDRSR